MINVYYDAETTGINPYHSEIIEAFFYISKDNFFHLKCRPDIWSYEAEKVHNIPEYVAMTYPKKKDAFRELLKWLPNNFRFITYANKNTELGFLNFDVAILVNELNLLGYKNYYLENVYNMKPNLSVHTMAREAASRRLFLPIRKKSKTGKMIQSLSQENVYMALFGANYDGAHDAKKDVMALIEIYNKLTMLISSENMLI